ncbi:LacI family transcriptional regulator [Yersinia pestis subsp. microtus bv. Caucasica]|uniref:LacI family DNA-binding transcriptional regulator n=1 Tax=Yersinia pestis TaxID=632 RepID=UPI0009761B51|nr:LacI family DNA-binding transcriptional regulator [Yersinia pestis]OMK84176.1 LacI family transcriptional regulator [Yersinia pestis subsp. microtus bv. Caucasica]
MSKAYSNATIVDIALRANVTNITVSRTFNQPGLVKQETREKIHAIAKELNYVPNAFAQGLKRSSSQIIGIVTSSMYNPFYSELIQTVSRIARTQCYQIMLFDTDGSEEAEMEAIQALFGYKACGILLSPVRDDKNYQPAYLDLAETYRVPLILIDRDIYNRQLSGVFLNNKEIGLLAGKYLSEQPERKMLIIGGPAESEITRVRIEGIINALENKKNDVHIINGDYDFISQEAAVRDYLSVPQNQPDYIIGLNGILTLGAIAICHELKIYNNIKFFSIDEPPKAADYGLHIAGVYHDTQMLGEIAAELLFNAIKKPHNDQAVRREFFTGSLLTH